MADKDKGAKKDAGAAAQENYEALALGKQELSSVQEQDDSNPPPPLADPREPAMTQEQQEQ